MYSMPWPWESKLSILQIFAFPIISDMRFWLSPIFSEIFSWVHPSRFKRMITLFLSVRCRARISEIQMLTVWRVTPKFCARLSSVQSVFLYTMPLYFILSRELKLLAKSFHRKDSHAIFFIIFCALMYLIKSRYRCPFLEIKNSRAYAFFSCFTLYCKLGDTFL